LYSPLPLLTTTSAIGIASYVAFGSLLAREVPQRTICLVLLWTFAAFCVVNVVSALVVPDVAYFQVDPIGEPGKTRFQGISGHPNQLGEIATIFGLTTIAAAWWRYAKPVVWVPSLLLALGLIIVSGSRTSLLSLVLSLGLQMPRRYLLPIGAVVIILGGGIVLSGHLDTLMGLVGRNGDAAEAMTMSGRTELWDFSSSLISARPLVGYGFNTFEAYAGTLWTGNANAAVVATHNNLLSVLYSTGIFGAIPFVTGFAILVYRWAVRPSFVRDLFVINAILTSFSEADVLSLIAPVPTLIFIIFVALDVTKDISGRTT
jgi:O-antigen ligase